MVTTIQRAPLTHGTTSSLIVSDRVEGTAVYDAHGKRIGKVERLMIDKLTGRIARDPEFRGLPRHRRGPISDSLVDVDLQ
jgi:hypothetical protein